MGSLTYGSLFSGAGGFDLGFDAAGLSCRWQCEIDPQASKVLARHWLGVTRFDDIRTVRGKDLAPVDVVVGGFPCQDLSVAGKRKGLSGERSGLFYELLRVVRLCRPRFVVWENVPGLLSSTTTEEDHGRCLCGWNFGWGRLSGGREERQVRDVRRAGVRRHVGEGEAHSGGVEEGVRRQSEEVAGGNGEVGGSVDVDAVRGGGGADAGVGRGPHDAEAIAGEAPDPTGGDEGGQPVTAVDGGDEEGGGVPQAERPRPQPARAATGPHIAVSGRSFCPGCGRRVDDSEITRPVRRSDMGAVVRGLADVGYFGAWRVLDARFFGVPQRRRRVFGVFARGRAGAVGCGQILALTQGVRGDSEAGRQEGEDVAFTLTSSVGRNSGDTRVGNAWNTTYVAGTLTGGRPKGGYNQRDESGLVVARCQTASHNDDRGEAGNLIAFTAKDHGADAGAQSPTLRAGGFKDSHQNGGVMPAVCFQQNQRDEVREMPIAGALAADHGMKQQNYVFSNRGIDGDGTAETLRAASHGALPPSATPHAVRRLTPRECERLMSWPDDHTRYDADGNEFADGPRYRMCGNGVVANVAQWLARRLMAFTETA